MVAPTLNNYEYQYKDTGLLINGTTAVPFFDVDKITGLDIPDLDPNIDDLDGQHGGTIRARYTKARIIVIEGILYAAAASIETTVDSTISNFLPDDTNAPFYYKHPGPAQRYINCKSLSLKMDTDSLRRIGASRYQIQLGAEDPGKYVDNTDITMVANTNAGVLNSGNLRTYPIITITGAWTGLTLQNVTQSKTLTLTDTRIAGDITVVDLRNASVTVNGIQKSSIASGSWWDVSPGVTEQIKYTVTGGPPTSVIAKTSSRWM